MHGFPTIPGFTCDAVLGRGGMAVVYEATEEALGRRVAIKVVYAGDTDEAQHVRRLEQEARGLANLQHPHIVELHSFGRTKEGALYYVMPKLDGGDLSSRSKPLDEAQLKSLLEAILGALAHAHASGIVHRDIKPGNILLAPDGRVQVADFGIAQAAAASPVTSTGITVGSVLYFSPEQARGDAATPASDIYSLGLVLYEMLTGQRA
ncbi:MAG TPA: serine/threonine-protein kinase, partial [Xanthomonadales bacterium]|nr:serine/threonine-protein kinase [Xanthomonadales bacterium]